MKNLWDRVCFAPFMGGGGGGGSSNTTTRTVYSPEEEAARSEIFKTGQELYKTQAADAGVYRGPKPIDPSAPTQQAWGTQMGVAGAAVPTAYDALGSASFNLTNGRDVATNPYLQRAISTAIQPQIDTFRDVTLPGLRLGGMGSGTLGSSRQGIAEGLAADRLQQSVGNTAMSMANTGYNTGTQAAVATQGQLPQIMSGAGAPGVLQSQVGAAQDAFTQDQASYASAVDSASVNGPWQLLQNWATMTNGMSNPSTSNTTSQEGGGGSAMQGIGAGIGMLAQFLPLLMSSDIRFKEDIKPIGTLADGQIVYSYRYKNNPTPQIGLMAQEVEKLYPEAVFTDPASGFKYVNYALATERASTLGLED